MSRSSIAIRRPLIYTLVFAICTSVVLAFVAMEFGDFKFGDRKHYSAIFTDASLLLEGDSVMVSGVEVGSIDDVSVHKEDDALISFNVKTEVVLAVGTNAVIRYRDLTGDRYLELVPGPTKNPELPDGATLQLKDTRPALDLDLLLGGFEPLFEGLDPGQVNQLAGELVSVLQGQGGTIESILERIASFSTTIANKDKVIGQTIESLNSVLKNLDTHTVGLSQTITSLQELTTGLSSDRSRLGRSFGKVEGLVTSVDGLLEELHGPLDGMVEELGRTVTQANKGADTINEVLRLLPGAYLRIGRLGSRGAGYNIYLCSLRVRLDGPNGGSLYTPYIGPDPSLDRCQLGTAPLETPEERIAKEEATEEKG
ncbi:MULTISPECIES: MCE family protein [unclassified Nocardioides]|uniref:MCE family protein n=1 Tax=unclassified Nocardioides TaxID=2615069 RepID=UPI0006F6F847|nr:MULTISPECIES: MlaD family protein [unclassified Nocardioides]KRA31082.1 mammalian cell entry protein [Nocardioides sp. Root614]KRA87702.1 mammalian cell entry protein [Nocardioides sp. Root682]